MNKTELLEKYSSNLSGSKNHNHYMSYARDFLGYAKELDKGNITKYVEHLRRKRMSPGTVNFAYRVVRRLFIVNGLEWPFNRGEAPLISQRDEYKAILAPNIIETMISKAKNGGLATDEGAFLALSTTYGLRREEMVNLQPGDLSLRNNTIYVATLKHGRQRYHLIPPEIKPYLKDHNFETRYSLTIMSQMFWRVVNKSSLEFLKQSRLGWHSIRHSLDRQLAKAGMNPFAIKAFLRWKGGSGELAMPERYYGGITIGFEGAHTEAIEAIEDEEVFEKYHPFLGLWK